jgi:hypothetical protein
MPRITVIIPTRGLPERMPLLQRAVTSALDQCDVAVSALVIVNVRASAVLRDAHFKCSSHHRSSLSIRCTLFQWPLMPCACPS